ncbi:MAG: hypothetical protein U0M06_11925 [Clostridia bacterium]|nr:hypothetical protein [Clostridia bacterium]
MKKTKNIAAFYYAVNLLRNLRGMKLITEDEYNRTVHISAEHYGVKFYCV